MNKVDPELKSERTRALVEMLTSEGWRHVARPALMVHSQQIARRIANSRSASLEQIREWQAEFALLCRMVEHPKSFFSLNERAPAESENAALE